MLPLVLITGASHGVGLTASVACAQAGWDVIATMSDLARRPALDAALEQAGLAAPEPGREVGVRDRAAVHLEQLDVTSPNSERKVRELLLKYGPIQGLVSCASALVTGAFEEQSDQDIQQQFAVNVFGVMALIRALLPSMRASGRGRIVNVSSISGRVGLPTLSIDAAARHALDGFTEALAQEVAPFGVEVCLVELGTVGPRDAMAEQRRGALVDRAGPYAARAEAIERALLDSLRAGPTPEQVGSTIAELLGATSPPLRTVVGNQARAVTALKKVVPEAWFAGALRRIMGL